MTFKRCKWWEKNPKKLLFEYKRVLALSQTQNKYFNEIQWVELQDNKLAIRGEIKIDEKIKNFELIYPHFYPSECPTVYPIPRGARWSTHQFGGEGALCLEFGADNWEPTLYSGADLLYSLLRLLCFEKNVEEKELPSNVIPSRHISTLGDNLRGKYYRLFSSKIFRDALKKVDGINKWKVRLFWQDENCILYPVELPLGTTINQTLPKRFLDKFCFYEGPIISLNPEVNQGLLDSAGNISDVNLLINKMSSHDIILGETDGFKIKDFKTFVPILLFSETESYAVFMMQGKDGEAKVYQAGIIEDDFESISYRMPKDLCGLLTSKKVAVVGLGSIGSKLCVSLGRSGVSDFVLVDNDIMLPGNIARNELDFDAIGGSKIDQVASAMKRILKNPKLTLHSTNIGSQSNTAIHEKILSNLRTCDIIIDCTANPECFSILAMLCNQSQKPLVWMEVFGGGIGGYVAKSVPNHTPCPSCVKRVLNSQLSKYPTVPNNINEKYTLEMEEGTPIIALDCDVSFVAAIATKTAIKILKCEELDNDVLIFGMTKSWIFDHTYQFYPIKVDSQDTYCPDCWNKPVEEELTSSESLAIQEILKSIKNDGNNQA